jgi:hypothetical protein
MRRGTRAAPGPIGQGSSRCRSRGGRSRACDGSKPSGSGIGTPACAAALISANSSAIGTSETVPFGSRRSTQRPLSPSISQVCRDAPPGMRLNRSSPASRSCSASTSPTPDASSFSMGGAYSRAADYSQRRRRKTDARVVDPTSSQICTAAQATATRKPTIGCLPGLSGTAQKIRPPANEPAMPNRIVPRIPMGCLPGTMRRASAPTIRPLTTSQIRKVISFSAARIPGPWLPESWLAG